MPSTTELPLTTNELILKVAGEILDAIKSLENKLMASADDIIADVQAETTLIAGLSTAVTSLKQQLTDALSGVNIPPDVQAKIDQAFDGLEANKDAVAKALTTAQDGTTPVPDVPPAPPTDQPTTGDQPQS